MGWGVGGSGPGSRSRAAAGRTRGRGVAAAGSLRRAKPPRPRLRALAPAPASPQLGTRVCVASVSSCRARRGAEAGPAPGAAAPRRPRGPHLPGARPRGARAGAPLTSSPCSKGPRSYVSLVKLKMNVRKTLGNQKNASKRRKRERRRAGPGKGLRLAEPGDGGPRDPARRRPPCARRRREGGVADPDLARAGAIRGAGLHPENYLLVWSPTSPPAM